MDTIAKLELKNAATCFYDGGYRAADIEDLREQINFNREDDNPISEEELGLLLDYLKNLEEEEVRNEEAE